MNYMANICIKICINWDNVGETEEKHVFSLWLIFTPIKGITASINQFIFSHTKAWNTASSSGIPSLKRT